MRVHYHIQSDFWLIAAVVLFLTCVECQGQVKRVKRYSTRQDITTIVPKHCMKFGGGDTMYVSISADSSNSGYDFKIFMFMPHDKDVRNYQLEIGFTSGNNVILTQGHTILEYNYIEYPLDKVALDRLESEDFDYILFRTFEYIEPCFNIKTKDFFCKFLQQYKD